MSDQETLASLTADIVAAHVSNNSVAVGDVAALIKNVHAALAGLQSAPVPEATKQEPAVSVRSSIKPDYLVSLESGKKMKMLKRYLMTNYQMTPAEYRAKWGLPADYPMVAPNYAQQRKELAVKIGLGRKPGAKRGKVVEPAPAPAPEPAPVAAKPARKPRTPKAKAPAA